MSAWSGARLALCVSTFLLLSSSRSLECTLCDLKASDHKLSLAQIHPCSPPSDTLLPYPSISLYPLFTPLSFSASLYPPLLPRKGVMPSLAREPKPRCLRWLLLETRSCREDRGGRDRTKVKESKKGMERGKKKGERSTGGLDE